MLEVENAPIAMPARPGAKDRTMAVRKHEYDLRTNVTHQLSDHTRPAPPDREASKLRSGAHQALRGQAAMKTKGQNGTP